MSMEIRRGTVADIDAILELRRDFSDELGMTALNPWGTVAPGLRAYCEEWLPTDGFVVLLGEEDGRAVCTASLEVRRCPPTCRMLLGMSGFISYVYTRPECRGRGLAAELMGALVKMGHGLGVEMLELVATPAGQSVYTRLGFAALEEPLMRLRVVEGEAVDQ